MRVVAVHGAARERGRTLGKALGPKIRAFVGAGPRRGTLPAARMADTLAPYTESVRKYAPELAAEVEGLAEGAEIPEVDGWLLQFRRELVDSPPLDCSTICVGEQNPILGQTVDLAGRMGQWMHLLHVRGDSGPRALLFTFAGLLGYLGINSAGLAVAINMVVSDDWKPGISPYLLVRIILTCTGIDEVLLLLERLPRSSSRCFTLVDTERSLCVEMTACGLRVLDTPVPICHTNHYLDPVMRRSERMRPLDRMESRVRLARLQELCRELAADAAAVGCLLVRPEFQKGPAATPEEIETVATVVMEPRSGTLWVQPPRQVWELHHV